MDAKTVLAFASMLFAAVAAYFLYSGFTLDTTIAAEGQTIANLELMHIQSLNFATGIGAAIIAAIFGAASALAR
jgi:uncharacterized membrane protein